MVSLYVCFIHAPCQEHPKVVTKAMHTVLPIAVYIVIKLGIFYKHKSKNAQWSLLVTHVVVNALHFITCSDINTVQREVARERNSIKNISGEC